MKFQIFVCKATFYGTLFQIQFLMKHSPPGSLGPLPRQSTYLLTLTHSVFVECVKNCSGLLRSVPHCPFLQQLVTERFLAPTLITSYLFLPVGLKLVSFKGTLCEVGVGRFPSNTPRQECVSPFFSFAQEMATHSSVLAWRSQGQRSLVGCRLWGRTESDTTE